MYLLRYEYKCGYDHCCTSHDRKEIIEYYNCKNYNEVCYIILEISMELLDHFNFVEEIEKEINEIILINEDNSHIDNKNNIKFPIEIDEYDDNFKKLISLYEISYNDKLYNLIKICQAYCKKYLDNHYPRFEVNKC